ncbi:MAG: phosphate-selective porin, partial [Candidatus Azotimanducaceae bacterium]
MNNLFTRYLVPTAALLTFASQTVAQNSETLEQSVSSSGSSVSDVLNSARYDFGRGLTFTSRDGEATMNISGQLQAGYNWTETDAVATATTNSNWSMPSSRLRVGGQAMDGLTYFMQLDPQGGGQGNGNLVDAWVGWQFNEAVHVRIGQQKMRSGLSADTSANDTDFETATRSLATNTFAGGRATGALFTGDAMEGKLNWHAGVMNNGTGPAPAAQANSNTDMAFTVGGSFGS